MAVFIRERGGNLLPDAVVYSKTTHMAVGGRMPHPIEEIIGVPD